MPLKENDTQVSGKAWVLFIDMDDLPEVQSQINGTATESIAGKVIPLWDVEVGRNYIENNFSGTLAQSLSAIPGVQARAIGSGQSKPAIRGLGFNRIAVAVDGIKHEGQQWGDDHGLEIDQFAVDRVEVIKGPGALMYGSDAIGGVLGIYTNYLPTKQFEGRVNLFGRSNNLSAGLSARLQGRSGPFYWKLHLTGSDYADYN